MHPTRSNEVIFILRMSKNKEVPVEKTVLRGIGGANFFVDYPISQSFVAKAVCFRGHWAFSTVNGFDVYELEIS